MICNLTKQDITEIKFNSEANVKSFYYEYVLFIGFLIRLSDHGQNKKNEMILCNYMYNSTRHKVMKYIKNNDRIRKHIAITICECKA